MSVILPGKFPAVAFMLMYFTRAVSPDQPYIQYDLDCAVSG
jgi:hypothetical protein